MTCTDDCAAVAETTEACGGATAGLLHTKAWKEFYASTEAYTYLGTSAPA